MILAEHPIQLKLRPDLYERIRQIGDQLAQPIDEVLVKIWGLLFGEPNSLDMTVLRAFTGQELWRVVSLHFILLNEARLRELREKKHVNLSEEEKRKLNTLSEDIERHKLIRSQAPALLQQRWYLTFPPS